MPLSKKIGFATCKTFFDISGLLYHHRNAIDMHLGYVCYKEKATPARHHP